MRDAAIERCVWQRREQQVEALAGHARLVVRPGQRRVVFDARETRDARGKMLAKKNCEGDVPAVAQNLLQDRREKVETIGVAACAEERQAQRTGCGEVLKIGRETQEGGIETFAGLRGKQGEDGVAGRHHGRSLVHNVGQEIAREARQATAIVRRQFLAGGRDGQHVIDEIVDTLGACGPHMTEFDRRHVTHNDDATCMDKRMWTQAHDRAGLLGYRAARNEMRHGPEKVIVHGR